jgi:DNA-binding NarL/FixJ family response regulator
MDPELGLRPRDSIPTETMRAVCIARHRFLSDHIASIFQEAGIECVPAVGFQDGMQRTRAQRPDVVICDYDLLVAAPLREWEQDAVLAEVPIVAVSLTRRPEEAHLVDANGIAGFLYLPGLGDTDVKRAVQGATSRPLRAPSFSLRWDHPSGETIHLD